MVSERSFRVGTILFGIIVALGIAQTVRVVVGENVAAAQAKSSSVPVFQVDPFWPKPLPNNWIAGSVSSAAVDSRDHIWIIHRPRTLEPREAGAAQKPPISECCIPAPPVIEFDANGNLVQAWGGPGVGYSWPEPNPGDDQMGSSQPAEHSIVVDEKDNVWITGMRHVVLKFTRDGKFLLQIGELGKTGGSNDTRLLGNPTRTATDVAANEVYVSDGYVNRRVIVFDATTGAYKRHWGAYGKRPDDTFRKQIGPQKPPPQQMATVHCVAIAKDGLVYVCDRANNRIQVFKKDGTFVKEGFVSTNTVFPSGTVWDIGFSPDAEQRYLYIPDGSNQKVWIVSRNELQVLGSFGRIGHMAGELYTPHNLAVDSKGNVYVAEVRNKRFQKFEFKGISSASKQ